MCEKSGWGRLSMLLFMVGFTGSVSIWQGGFVAWFLFFGSLLLLMPALIVLVTTCRLEGDRTLVNNRVTKLVDVTSIRSGETVRVCWRMRVDSVLPMPWLTLSETWYDADGTVAYQANKLMFPWMSRTITWTYELPVWGRGEYASSGLLAVSGDLPGIVLLKRRLSSLQRILVWPHIRNVSQGELGESAAAAVRNAAVVAEEADPSAERRPYRPGDSMRRIDWRASARASSWLVRDREWTSPSRIWIMADVERAAYDGERGRQRFEAVIELAASLLHTWDVREMEAVLAIAEAGDLIYTAGGAARMDAMNSLASAAPNGRRPFHQRLTALLEWIRSGDHIIVITPKLDEALYKSASIVQEAGGHIQLWFPQCESMPSCHSRWEEWNGRMEGMNIVRWLSGYTETGLPRTNLHRGLDDARGVTHA